MKDRKNPTIELEQIRLPVAIRANTIHPSVFRVFYLLIVWEEVRIFIHDGTIGSKHQQSCIRQAVFARLPVFSKHVQFLQELIFWQYVPNMVRVPLLKPATILLDRVCIQIFLAEVLQYSSIYGTCQICIRKHTVHFFTRTMVIAIKVTSISARIGVKPTIHRSQASVNSRNIEKQEIRSIEPDSLHIILFQQWNVYTFLAVHPIEKVLFVLLRLFFRHPIKIELIIFLLNSEDDGPTIRIGKRRIRLPKRMRESPFR